MFPPDPARASTPGQLADAFGADAHVERYRILSRFGEGWTYYSFLNPAIGRYVPKVSCITGLD